MAKKSVDKMTKAELVREVKRLQKQLDKMARIGGNPLLDKPRSTLGDAGECTTPPAPKFPWDALPNAFEGAR